MKRDRLFRRAATSRRPFVFDENVAEVFDDMLLRSIPMYQEQQAMVAEIGETFWLPGTDIYDLGCSTATTLIGLAKTIPQARRLIGYDSSTPMLERAARAVAAAGLESRIDLRQADLDGDLSGVALENASVITMGWTLQFISPLRRQRLIEWVRSALVPGGVFVVTEKVLTNDSDMNRFFIDFYHEMKRRNGYSESEISRKREALENVLVPYRIEENLQMFRRCGFDSVETFFQWYNFAGFLCVNGPR